MPAIKNASNANSNFDLRKITQEIYKQNAELAVKNRTLSLLYKLYDVATHNVHVDDVVRQLTTTIQHSFHLPFFGFIISNSAHTQFFPLIAVGDRLKKSHIFSNIKLQDAGKYALEYNDPFVRSLLHSRRKQVSVHWIEATYAIKLSEWKPFKRQLPQYFYALPLTINDSPVGFMVIGLDTKFLEMNTFEREMIENVKNAFAISVDKGLIYDDLLTANEQLKELDRQKTEFLSIASHQLRTPLSIIKGFIELIGDGAYGTVTPELKTVLGDMDQSNERLVKLVDDFLDVTRIEQGRTKYSFAQINLSDVVESVNKELAQKALDAHVEVLFTPLPKLKKVHVDEEKIRHVVFNYIDNAIKYIGNGSTIKVTVEEENKGITLKVTDDGLGFAMSDQANFFQKFYRGENVKGTNVNGTGLGIYVCRKFIEAHEGHVWAKSAGLGKGSEFGFWIPEKQPK